MRDIPLILTLILVAGCGSKGALYLPEEPPEQPAAQTSAADDETAAEEEEDNEL